MPEGRKINLDDLKGPPSAASATENAEFRGVLGLTTISSSENGDIGLQHDQSTLILTHATPEWTIPLQSEVDFPDNFKVTIIAVNGLSLAADVGVEINGIDGGSEEITEWADLTRLASDEWRLTINATGGSVSLTISQLVSLLASASGGDLTDIANALATALSTGMVDGDAESLLARFEALDPGARADFLAHMATGLSFDGDINPGEFWTTDPSGALVGRAFGGTTLQNIAERLANTLPPDAETLGRTGITYWKQPVRVASTANGTLSTAFASGQTVDGVTLALGDRILLKDQSSANNNGIWVVTADTPTRAEDADSAELLAGMVVLVQEGSTNADTIWLLQTDTITLDSTSLVFSQVGAGGSLDALLTAIAALTTVAGGEMRFTGTDTVAVVKTAEYPTTGVSGAVTLDLANSLIQKMTMSGDITDFNPPTLPSGVSETLYGEFIFRQDASVGTQGVTLDSAIELEGPDFEGGWDGPETGVDVETVYGYKIGPSGVCYIYSRAVRW